MHPLRVANLHLQGWRNLAPLQWTPGERFNVLFGDNGAGKSNLLEAIGYMASLRSFRSAKKEDLIARDAAGAQLDVRLVAGDGPSSTHRALIDRVKPRKVTVDGKRPRSVAAYYSTFPLVLFHPGDVELAVGSPEGRRALLDRVLEQVEPGYHGILAEYQKALRSRNRLLKAAEVDRASVTAYDSLLARHGATVGQHRTRLVEQLAPRVETHFADITDRALPLSFSYQARHEPDEQGLARALRDGLNKDLARGFTGVGPHGDDVRIAVKDTLAKHHASQGQHRAIVLALKVAELSVLARRAGRIPLLLLDDVSSELDRSRNRRFFALLAKLGGQVFLTTTHRDFIELDEYRSDFHIHGGELSPSPR